MSSVNKVLAENNGNVALDPDVHPEESADLRQYRLLLVEHAVVNLTVEPQAQAQRNLVEKVVSWARRNGYGIYQLPPSDYLFMRESQTSSDLSQLSHANREDLDFVFSQLRTYQDSGYKVVGLVAGNQATPEREQWIADVAHMARKSGVIVPEIWRTALRAHATFDATSQPFVTTQNPVEQVNA